MFAIPPVFAAASKLRHLLLALMLGLVVPVSTHAATANCTKPWPAWDAFKKTLISQDGRVIDGSGEAMKTTSEGQAYALFFSLVANDRKTFDLLLEWTEKNLAQGDLASHLPAWAWGKKGDGSWGVLDENSASDADLWLAYALGEAGRLWTERRYVALSSLVASHILTTETQDVPGLGLVLLPGAMGFVGEDGSVRLNPSYVPLQLMRWFATHGQDPRWVSLLDSSRQLLADSAPKGYAPDWIVYRPKQGFSPDSGGDKKAGSYDAIRVYLWAGMLNPGDANRRALLDTLKPMAQYVKSSGYPPEFTQTSTGETEGTGSSGFSAAVIPLLQAAGFDGAVEKQLQRIAAQPIAKDAYYDQVLGLYGLGWHDNLYRFAPKGNLTPFWMPSCQ